MKGNVRVCVFVKLEYKERTDVDAHFSGNCARVNPFVIRYFLRADFIICTKIGQRGRRSRPHMTIYIIYTEKGRMAHM